MMRHLSTGTATIAALMAAHRRVAEASSCAARLDEFFRQEAARIESGACADRNGGRPHEPSPARPDASLERYRRRA